MVISIKIINGHLDVFVFAVQKQFLLISLAKQCSSFLFVPPVI